MTTLRIKDRLGSPALIAAALVVVIGSFSIVGASPLRLFENPSSLFRLINEFINPSFENLENKLGLIFESFLMAIFGTFLGSLVALPLGFFASKTLGINSIFRLVAKGLILFTRAVPSLVFALILVRILGFGPIVGAIALGVSSVGMIGRQVTDALDTQNTEILQSKRALGLSSLQFGSSILFPAVFSSVIATVLYRLEINLRSSSILGFVGAGGVGIALATDLGQLNYGGAIGTTLIIVLFVLVFEYVSSKTRGYLSKSNEAGRNRASLGKKVFDPALNFYLFPLLFLSISTLALLVLASNSEFRVRDSESIALLASKFWPPNFTDFSEMIFQGVVETFAIAVSGTTLGLFFAFLLAFFGARNLASNKVIRLFSRLIMSTLRTLPDLVVVLLFVVAVGLGPQAGMYAVALGTAGILGRLLSDIFEDTSESVVMTFAALAKPSIWLFVSGVVPSNSRRIGATILHVLDINIRVSISLGIVGVGGIGMLLSGAVSAIAFDTVTAILIILVLTIVLLEKITSKIKNI